MTAPAEGNIFPCMEVAMSDTTTNREATDDALTEEQHAAAQDALQAALDTHRTLKNAQIDFDRAAATLAKARRNHAEACAKLVPFQRAAQVAA